MPAWPPIRPNSSSGRSCSCAAGWSIIVTGRGAGSGAGPGSSAPAGLASGASRGCGAPEIGARTWKSTSPGVPPLDVLEGRSAFECWPLELQPVARHWQSRQPPRGHNIHRGQLQGWTTTHRALRSGFTSSTRSQGESERERALGERASRGQLPGHVPCMRGRFPRFRLRTPPLRFWHICMVLVPRGLPCFKVP